MTELFTIRFTTKKLVKKYDSKGKLVAETQIDTPVTMHALPHTTAMSYSGCDNFQKERYEPDERFKRASKGSGRDASVGNGTKKFERVAEGMKSGKTLNPVMSGSGGKSKLAQAAATGDLGAAING